MKIKINNKDCKFEKGDTLIQVADRNGIHIPRFCYHDKLSIAANCRMCLVEQVGINKPQPACSTPAIENLIKFYDKPDITIIGSSASIEILKKNPNFKKSIVLDKNYLSIIKAAKNKAFFW